LPSCRVNFEIPWKDLTGIPSRVLAAIADQVQVPASAFARYGERDNTLYEHLDEIRRGCGLRECGWREYLWLARQLLPLAMESDRPVPLIEQALELLRAEGIIAPGLTHLERLVWIVLKAAEKRLFRLLTADLTLEHRSRLDGLLYADTGRRGTARLSWLREPPGVTSAKSVKQIVERLLFLRGLELPAVSPALHQNRILQLARKCSKYQTQPLLKFTAERRHALLVAHLFELSQDLTDQALDQFDKLLGELMRKHALNGSEIAPNYYEAAAFESLKGRVRSGDIAVGGSRRYRAFEGYLLPQAHFEQLAEKNRTRLAVTNEAGDHREAGCPRGEYREGRREFTLG
jgi:hypothetical protein